MTILTRSRGRTGLSVRLFFFFFRAPEGCVNFSLRVRVRAPARCVCTICARYPHRARVRGACTCTLRVHVREFFLFAPHSPLRSAAREHHPSGGVHPQGARPHTCGVLPPPSVGPLRSQKIIFI